MGCRSWFRRYSRRSARCRWSTRGWTSFTSWCSCRCMFGSSRFSVSVVCGGFSSYTFVTSRARSVGTSRSLGMSSIVISGTKVEWIIIENHHFLFWSSADRFRVGFLRLNRTTFLSFCNRSSTGTSIRGRPGSMCYSRLKNMCYCRFENMCYSRLENVCISLFENMCYRHFENMCYSRFPNHRSGFLIQGSRRVSAVTLDKGRCLKVKVLERTIRNL